MRNLPVVDLEPWRSGGSRGRLEVVRAVDHAMREVGFFQLTGHGVPIAAVDAAFWCMDEFFTLPSSAKAVCRPHDPALYRGYVPRRSESFSYSVGVPRPADLVEAFVMGADDVDEAQRHGPHAPNVWPTRPAEFADLVWRYYLAARDVSCDLVRIAAAAWHLDTEACEAMLTNANVTMRCNWYQRSPDDGPLDPAQMSLGAHTDYGLFTVLAADDQPGLQVLLPDDGWVDVTPRPGAFVVNAGDATAMLTNDWWRSTLHRVVPPAAPTAPRRRSIALFQDGNVEAVVACVPSSVSADRPARYQPVTLGQHVLDKIQGGRASVIPDTQQTIAGRTASL